MKLLRSQRNNLFDIIESAGLSPSAFVIVEPDAFANLETIIRYLHSQFYFSVSLHHDKQFMIVKYSPGKDIFEKENWVRTWDEVEANFSIFVDSLFLEINEIDKWGRLKNELDQINVTYTNESDKFSADEYVDLQQKMNLLKLEMKNLSFDPEQIQILENKIDHLTTIAVTLTKFDWKSLFIGTIVSIIIQLGVTQENAKAFWGVIKRLFNKYFLP